MTNKKYWNNKVTPGNELNSKEKTLGQSDD